ncbi:unnamed protein product [Prorocentrum cordatum]|uniref:Sialidase domain-containing protein n=1 Tax=Prorocentrum cordatum TaxID=2364126 RepID=A0ABN9YA50_9DINO|nr:unnamed protein product [Polarella glacialis]
MSEGFESEGKPTVAPAAAATTTPPPPRRPDAAAVGAARVGPGAGCANWAELAVGPPAHDEVACALSCSTAPGCALWNFRASEGGGCHDVGVSSCVLLPADLWAAGSRCVYQESPCWDLRTHPGALPASRLEPAGRPRLVAFAEARRRTCLDDSGWKIAVSHSDDSGKTWSSASFATEGKYARRFNPYSIALHSGKIVLLYGAATAAGQHRIGMVHSVTDGETWSAEADVSDQFGSASLSNPGPGTGITVSMPGGGERLFVVSHRGAYRYVSVTVSDDEGLTWRTLNTSFPAMDESTIASLGGGELLLAMRHEEMGTEGRAASRSSDLGVTWSPIEYNRELPSAICQGQLLHHDGALYFSGPLASKPGMFWRRRFLVVRRSDDGGRSWYGDRLVHLADSAGYSTMAPVTSSTLGVLFETDRGIEFSTVRA